MIPKRSPLKGLKKKRNPWAFFSRFYGILCCFEGLMKGGEKPELVLFLYANKNKPDLSKRYVVVELMGQIHV